MTPPDTIVKPQTTFVVVAQESLEQPYRVIIENDDVTPMDFVVMVLTGIFALDMLQAVDVMLVAHHHGEALVTILPYQEASTKIYQAHDFAGQNNYPLRLYMEPD